MLFNSFEFILVFLPITFIVYFWLNKQRLTQAAKGWLVFASIFFYSFWNIKYLPLILCSLLVNYSIGSSFKTGSAKQKISSKAILTFGIVLNLGLLGYFKYMDFFIANINSIFHTNHELLHIALPLAISFFTFQQIAYLVDAYKGEANEYNFINYAIFVTFFPQLIAGPIVHHSEMMPQFDSLKTKIINHKNLAIGFFLFAVGLSKKVIIADFMAVYANGGFSFAQSLTCFDAWITSLAYSAQLYFDFSGYTDMALGLGYMFNIVLPQNFNSPYRATSIQDFWRRWHMTLSRFLKDYIYIPLGGNRKGEFKTHFNLVATFALGGLWHGASWTFVLWGLLHGFALCIQRLWQKTGIKMHSAIAWFLTFNFVNIGWVFFRATSLEDALSIIKSMFDFTNFALPTEILAKIPLFITLGFEKYYSVFDKTYNTAIAVILFVAVVVFIKNTDNLQKYFKPSKLYLTITISLMFIALSLFSRVSEFLYFNF